MYNFVHLGRLVSVLAQWDFIRDFIKIFCCCRLFFGSLMKLLRNKCSSIWWSSFGRFSRIQVANGKEGGLRWSWTATLRIDLNSSSLVNTLKSELVCSCSSFFSFSRQTFRHKTPFDEANKVHDLNRLQKKIRFLRMFHG